MRIITWALLALIAVPVVASAQPIDGAGRVLQRVNAERAAHGCGPLKISDQLTMAAERESRDMATQHFFNHTEPDGTTPGKRVKDTGYIYQMVGENIVADTEDADDAVDAWMNSPGHRANILTCAFRETGIAVYEQDDDAPVNGVPGVYRAYWTQVFAMPLR
ncbi:CAP domain-containing protein [Asticcacaulis solisilvae]|uniref:CAP domain-containing protein n=1 Tax=Asticcacaulis solisilvae TaxID=1217274 RepID=UPI003FD71043